MAFHYNRRPEVCEIGKTFWVAWKFTAICVCNSKVSLFCTKFILTRKFVNGNESRNYKIVSSHQLWKLSGILWRYSMSTKILHPGCLNVWWTGWLWVCKHHSPILPNSEFFNKFKQFSMYVISKGELSAHLLNSTFHSCIQMFQWVDLFLVKMLFVLVSGEVARVSTAYVIC